jgi:hypothetical protein
LGLGLRCDHPGGSPGRLLANPAAFEDRHLSLLASKPPRY